LRQARLLKFDAIGSDPFGSQHQLLGNRDFAFVIKKNIIAEFD
jgi:hypothetical protein